MLTGDQITAFRTKGYLVVEDLIDETTLAALQREYAAAMTDQCSDWLNAGLLTDPVKGEGFLDRLDQCRKGGFDWYQPFDISLPHDGIVEDTPMHLGPAVFDLMTHPRILDLAEDLLGPEITSNPIQHTRIKPPQRALAGAEARAHVIATDWHQDMGVTLEEADETEFITVWLAVTDATIENGCLQVLPGRRDAMMPHCAKTQVGIPDDFIPASNAVPTPVKAGGAVILHPLTPHASLANTSDEYRWSFDLRYNITGQPTGRSQFPEFVARSRANPDDELKDWREWQAMWDRARHRLANSEHIAQHGRWDANAPYCA
ncbi:MAG: phytanoyl-CoA dioxygenase family protein [Pikeienuella sp.]